MEVRDPIHGAIPVADGEVPILDHPFVQRLRNIKQVGFSELPFPGAVHSRYNHSIGVMFLAGRAFDAAYRDHSFSAPAVREAYRSCVRLAALLHDVGHAPFSHCTEFAMPPLQDLDIQVYDPAVLQARGQHRASHEDYTVGILTQSSLADLLRQDLPFSPRHIAGLISREVTLTDDFFLDGGLDHRLALSQLISSELDVDRLDYLVRDSYFSGARYGMVDVGWLVSNLGLHVANDQVSLALNRRAIYAFDDFMVARYHMFVMVYFHHKSVVFEEMLKRYFLAPDCDYALPADMEAYLHVDDVQLFSHLRQTDDPWARAVVERRPWKRVLEVHGTPAEVDTSNAEARLRGAGLDVLAAGSVGKLSRYAVFGQKRASAPPIYVVDDSPGLKRTVKPLQEATRIFQRYEDERQIARLYVDPADEPAAQALLES
jgi:uncharacterized protein